MWICDECLKKYYENKVLPVQNVKECYICRRYIECNQMALRILIGRKNKK